MHEPPKVSVCMVAYNHDRFVAQAVESALCQETDFDFEIVVADDCSTDHTREILSELHRKHPDRLRTLLNERNLGMNQNFARAYAACRGRYIAMLEGDDYWTSDTKLQRQAQFLDTNPYHVITCHRAKHVDQDGHDLNIVFPDNTVQAITTETLLLRNPIQTCSAMIRGSALAEIPTWLFSLRLGDWPLFALLSQCGLIHISNEVCAAYRVHGGGTWSSLSQHQRVTEVIRMLTALLPHLDPRHHDTVQRSVAKHLSELSCIYEEDVKGVRNSLSYRLGRSITRPARFIRELINGMRPT